MLKELTPDLLVATYDFLRQTPPFCRRTWPVPPSDEVTFIVGRDPHTQAYHRTKSKRKGHPHEIMISEARVKLLATLTYVMAHEMVHLVQEELGTGTPARHDRGKYQGHNADFQRRANIVCKFHGWDPGDF